MHWNKLEWINPRSKIKRNKPYSVSSNTFDLNKGDRTSNWVGNSALKELDNIDIFKRRQMIEDMESELTEASAINSKTVNLAVTEDVDIDESIPSYLKKELKTQAYKKTVNIDIEQINTFENINKVNTTQWRTIY